MKAIKTFGAGLAGSALAGLMLVGPVSTQTATATQEVSAANAADYYKAKCTVCHGAAAEKKFDSTLSEDQLVDAVMKGKKPEKPPNMPAFEPKGVTAEQAKGLVDYMKQLKAAPGE